MTQTHHERIQGFYKKIASEYKTRDGYVVSYETITNNWLRVNFAAHETLKNMLEKHARVQPPAKGYNRPGQFNFMFQEKGLNDFLKEQLTNPTIGMIHSYIIHDLEKPIELQQLQRLADRMQKEGQITIHYTNAENPSNRLDPEKLNAQEKRKALRRVNPEDMEKLVEQAIIIAEKN